MRTDPVGNTRWKTGHVRASLVGMKQGTQRDAAHPSHLYIQGPVQPPEPAVKRLLHPALFPQHHLVHRLPDDSNARVSLRIPIPSRRHRGSRDLRGVQGGHVRLEQLPLTPKPLVRATLLRVRDSNTSGPEAPAQDTQARD
jgi:hypothetical protein